MLPIEKPEKNFFHKMLTRRKSRFDKKKMDRNLTLDIIFKFFFNSITSKCNVKKSPEVLMSNNDFFT